MLWYKNWLETRSRVAFNLIVVLGLFAFFFIHSSLGLGKSHPPLPNYGVVALVSLTAFVHLAGSGVRTQAGQLTMMLNTKSTTYTLSLPVSRCRLLFMRSAIGLLEGIALCLVNTILMWSYLRGAVRIFDIAGPLLATIVGGICIYFVATLLSTFLNEVLYLYVVWIVLFLYIAIVMKSWMPGFLNILAITIDPFGKGEIPWFPMAIYLVLAAIFLFASKKVLEAQDY